MSCCREKEVDISTGNTIQVNSFNWSATELDFWGIWESYLQSCLI